MFVLVFIRRYTRRHEALKTEIDTEHCGIDDQLNNCIKVESSARDEIEQLTFCKLEKQSGNGGIEDHSEICVGHELSEIGGNEKQ